MLIAKPILSVCMPNQGPIVIDYDSLRIKPKNTESLTKEILTIRAITTERLHVPGLKSLNYVRLYHNISTLAKDFIQTG